MRKDNGWFDSMYETDATPDPVVVADPSDDPWSTARKAYDDELDFYRAETAWDIAALDPKW